ncbi:MAG: SpoIID/LytB domain-containing protein [Clostridia bacterium]|nr:SpoIID/LytB domain-containing protein [Clostridia bacterium]
MRNRIIAIFTLAVLLVSLALPFMSASAKSDYSTVRVKLSIGDYETKKEVSLKGTYYIPEINSTVTDGKLYISTDSDTGILSVRYSSSGSESSATLIFDSGNIMTLRRTKAEIEAGYFSLYNTNHNLTLNYLGDLTIRTYKSSSGHHLRLINTVCMLHYLYGVVPNEMPEYSPLEALKSQAIASKGFVCYKIDTTSSSSIYDTRDTSQDQVYEGYSPAFVKCIAAVDATINEAMYLDGKLFPTFYSHSNGGETVMPEQAWGYPTYYDGAYKQVSDPYDLENNGSRVEMAFFPSENTSKYLTETTQPKNDGIWYSSYKKINSFLLSYTRQALVSAGVATMNAQVLSINSISDMYSTNAEGTTESVDHVYAHVTLNASVTADDIIMDTVLKKGVLTLNEPLKLTDSVLKSTALKETEEERTTRDITFSFTFKMSELYSLNVMTRTELRIYNVQQVDGGYAVYHRRFGHGVGLSQSSAQIMASDKYNMTYDEILAFFFPGATLGFFELVPAPIFTMPPVLTTPTARPTPTPKPTPTPTTPVSDYIFNDKIQTLTNVGYSLSPSEFFAPIYGAHLLSFGHIEPKFIGTNSVISYMGKQYTVVIYGDVDGDGTCNILDANLIMQHVVGIKKLEGAYALAADIDSSGSLNVYDATLVSQAVVGISKINQAR